MLTFTIALLILTLFSTLATYLYIHYAYRQNLLDIPNERSSHSTITPRGGGLIFIALWILTALTLPLYDPNAKEILLILLPGTLLVAIIGFLDDCYSLRAKYRALGYFFAACMSVFLLGGLDHLTLSQEFLLPLGAVGGVFAVLVLLWSTNLFNFMDGTDGIAAIEALFILIVGGAFLFASDAAILGILAYSLAACVMGFLVWNKPPAKLFMGDVGSTALGFVLMLLAIIGEQKYAVPLLLWLILYMAFLIDTAFTLVRRILAGERWYEAHRSHAYQRLHQIGWSHRKILVGLIVINTFLSSLALIAFFFRDLIFPMFLLSIASISLLYIVIEKLRPMYKY